MLLDILLVDNDPNFVKILAELLELVGYTVRTTDNGQGALGWMSERPATVVIICDDLPDFTGSDLVAYLRAVAKVRRSEQPLIAISNRSDLVYPNDPGAQGFDHVHSKASVDGLLALLARLMAD